MSPDLMYIYTLCLPYLYGMTHVSKVGSVFTTLAVSLERYFAVCRPLWIRIRRCHPAMYILLVTIFAFGFNVPKFLEFKVRVNTRMHHRRRKEWYMVRASADIQLSMLRDSALLINRKIRQYIAIKRHSVTCHWESSMEYGRQSRA